MPADRSALRGRSHRDHPRWAGLRNATVRHWSGCGFRAPGGPGHCGRPGV